MGIISAVCVCLYTKQINRSLAVSAEGGLCVFYVLFPWQFISLFCITIYNSIKFRFWWELFPINIAMKKAFQELISKIISNLKTRLLLIGRFVK